MIENNESTIEWLSPNNYLESFAAWCERNVQADSALPIRILFTGAAGTGKTAAVGLLARTLGLAGHIVPVGHLGGTNGEQQRAWQNALDASEGGILVLEAPVDLSAASWTEVREALTELADRGHRMAVVWMQYRDREWDRTSAWPGSERAWVQSYLNTNFSKHVGFPSLSATQLVEVAAEMVAAGEYVLTSDAADALLDRVSELARRPTASGIPFMDHLANRRFARRLVDIAADCLAKRNADLESVSATDRVELTRSDVLAGIDSLLGVRGAVY